MTQGGYQVIIILPIKSKMAAAKKPCFFAISVFNLALHELDFFLYFSLENSILSCHSRATTSFAAPKKTAIFIYDILTSKLNIEICFIMYTLVLPYLFTLSYNPVSTHSINQNSYYKLCFTKIHK